MQCYLWCQELLFLITCLAMCLVSTLAFVFFGDLVSYHGLTLPVVILAVCGVLGFLVTCLVHYQRFYGDEQSRCCMIMVGVFFVCCGLGTLIFLASFTRKPNHVGKMAAYLTDKEHKRMIDRTQMLLGCCGDAAYSDWFKVDWQGFDSVTWGQMPPSDVISRTAVPFSCCSPKAIPPCVHNYLQLDKDSRLYRAGCKEVIVLVASVFLFNMAASLVITGVFMLQWGYCCRDEDEDDYEVVSSFTDDKTDLVEVSSEGSCSGGSQDGRSATSATPVTTTATATTTATTDVTTTQESEFESTGAEETKAGDTETEKETGNVNMGAESANETDVQTGDETGNDTEPDTGGVTEDETTGNETDKEDNRESSAVETDNEEVTDREGDTDGGGDTDRGGETDATEGRGDTNTDDEKSWPKSDPSTEGEPTKLSEDDMRNRLEDEGVTGDTDVTSGEESRPGETSDMGGGGTTTASYVDDPSASNSAFVKSASGTPVIASPIPPEAKTDSVQSLKSVDLSNRAMDGSNTDGTTTAGEPTTTEDDELEGFEEGKGKNKSLKWN